MYYSVRVKWRDAVQRAGWMSSLDAKEKTAQEVVSCGFLLNEGVVDLVLCQSFSVTEDGDILTLGVQVIPRAWITEMEILYGKPKADQSKTATAFTPGSSGESAARL